MIIRLTVNDNDFTSDIESFADDLFWKLFHIDLNNNESAVERANEIKRHEIIEKLLNVNITNEFNFTTEDKLFLRAILFIKWSKYVESLTVNEQTKKYLKDNFEADISFKFEDQWENGEVLYYFTKSQKWIVQ